MSDGYWVYRKRYGNDSGSLAVGGLSPTTATLVTCKFKGQNQIFVQRVHIHISQAVPGVTWSIQDSAGFLVTGLVPASASPTQDPIGAEYDFGPVGLGITPGANLLFVASGAGVIGDVSWDAYQRQPVGTAAVP